MFSKIYSPNILSAASSRTGEPSYSHHADHEIGVAVIDRFTYYNLETLEFLKPNDQETIAYLFGTYDYQKMHSHPTFGTHLFKRPLDKAYVTDFFGSVQSVELTQTGYSLRTIESSTTNPKPVESHSPIDTNSQSQMVLKLNRVKEIVLLNEIQLNFWIGCLIFASIILISLF
ncbi:hypothetical protein HDV02_003294 [Globomyces sp. JEL0801]|nr:hypothetical protein HDV02_003294 [Globomyces sp. JEL0801]